MKLCIHGLTRSIWLLAVATIAACGGGNDSVDAPSIPAIMASVPFPARKAATVTGASGVVIGMHQALYGIAPSNAMLLDYTAQATTDASTFAQKLASTLNNNSHADLAKLVLDNLGVTPTSVPAINARGESEYDLLLDAVKQAFAAFPTMRGQVILNMTNLLAGLEIDATYGAAATAYNKHAADNFSESSIVDPATCVDKEVIGVVAFRGEGLAFSPQVDGFALMMAPLTNGPHTQEELRAVAQNFFTAHPYAYGGFTPNFHFSAEGAGLALFDWSPSDFGGVALVDKSGASVVFAGHVVWSGSGDILYPGLGSGSNGIVYSDAAPVAPMPSEFVSLSDWNKPIITDPVSGSRALTVTETTAFSDASFAMLRKTDLLHGFSACGNYSVASYVYTPTVGLTMAKPARQLYIVRGRTTQHWQPSR